MNTKCMLDQTYVQSAAREHLCPLKKFNPWFCPLTIAQVLVQHTNSKLDTIAQYSTLCNILIKTWNHSSQSEIGFNIGGYELASIEIKRVIRLSTSVCCSKELRSTSTSESQAVLDEVRAVNSVLTFVSPD